MEVKGNPRRSEEEYVVKATTETKENTSKRKRQEEESVLSDEIILHEILPWIPVKPLFRFKLVCKEWCRVISTDSFFKTSQSQKCVSLPSPGLVYYGHKNYVVLPTAIDKDLVGMPDLWLKYVKMCEPGYHKVFNHVCRRSMVASSNGLLCGSYYRGTSEYFYVSNPITKELVSIPNSSKLSDITLAFEPSSCNPYYVLVGRNVINVELDQNSNGNDITDVGFTVYSSKLGLWKTANAKVQIFRRSFGNFFSRTLSRSVFMSGKLHWKLEKDLLWFHIEEDSAGAVAFPDGEETLSDGEIGEYWNGELSYTKISAQTIEIYVLRSNQKFEVKWVKKYCLSLMRIFEDNVKVILPYFHTMMKLTTKLSAGSNHRRPLPYEGGNMVLFWVKKTEGKEEGIVFSYDITTGSLQLNFKSELRRWEGLLLSYKSTLVSLPQPYDLNQCCNTGETIPSLM